MSDFQFVICTYPADPFRYFYFFDREILVSDKPQHFIEQFNVSVCAFVTHSFSPHVAPSSQPLALSTHHHPLARPQAIAMVIA
jgi:hypothetical protein